MNSQKVEAIRDLLRNIVDTTQTCARPEYIDPEEYYIDRMELIYADVHRCLDLLTDE